MDLSNFLIHFGYEIGLLKERGIEYADLNHDDDSIWLTPGNDIDIIHITDFGFFTTRLVDAAMEAWDGLPTKVKLFYLDIAVIAAIRNGSDEPHPDMVTKIIYQGLPHPIILYSPTGEANNLPIPELVIDPEHIPLADAILSYFRAMPNRFQQQNKLGIPCKFRKKPDEPEEPEASDESEAGD